MGDRDRIRWDDWGDDDGAGDGAGRAEADEDIGDAGRHAEWEASGTVRGPTSRGNRLIAVVVLAVFLATIVLCCVAVGEAGQLLWLEPPPP